MTLKQNWLFETNSFLWFSKLLGLSCQGLNVLNRFFFLMENLRSTQCKIDGPLPKTKKKIGLENIYRQQLTNYLNRASQVKYFVQLDLPLHLLLRNSVTSQNTMSLKSNVTLMKFASQLILHTRDPHIIHYAVQYSVVIKYPLCGVVQ